MVYRDETYTHFGRYMQRTRGLFNSFLKMFQAEFGSV